MNKLNAGALLVLALSSIAHAENKPPEIARKLFAGEQTEYPALLLMNECQRFSKGIPQLTWDGNAFKPERGSNHKYFVKCDWKLSDGTEALETWSISPTPAGAMVIQHLSGYWVDGESTARNSNSPRTRELAQQMLDRLAALSTK